MIARLIGLASAFAAGAAPLDSVVSGVRAEAERTAAAAPACEASDRACLARELKIRFELDQGLRAGLERCAEVAEAEQQACVNAVGGLMLGYDEQNTARLKAVIAAHGWPAADAWGRDVELAAWHLLQHAISAGEKDVALQREMLPAVKRSVDRGGLSPWHYAALADRLRMRTEKRQTYGTQTACRDGRAEAYDLAEPEAVDARRQAIGLPPLGPELAEKSAACRA